MVAHRPALTTRRKDRPMAAKQLPDSATLRQLLKYDPETGKLYWKRRGQDMFKTKRSCSTWNSRFAGKEALCSTNRGYKLGVINYQRYFAHRVIWAILHDECPSGQIDHIDGDRGNNTPSNLRVVSNQENARNAKIYTTSTTGVVGVYYVEKSNRWSARITVDGKTVCLGQFATKREAAQKRKAAEQKYNFHPNHGKRTAAIAAKPT